MEDELALLQAALINAHIRELPETTLLELERQSNEWSVLPTPELAHPVVNPLAARYRAR